MRLLSANRQDLESEGAGTDFQRQFWKVAVWLLASGH